jgi:hypothetical protein
MKAFLITLLLFAIAPVHAETGILFPPNQALLIIQGPDSEAKELFDSINVTAIPEAGLLKKEINLNTTLGPVGEPVFNLICKYSELSHAASCTLKVFPAMETSISRDRKYFLVGVNDRYAAPRIAKMFLDLDTNNHQRIVFHSINGKFKIWKMLDVDGKTVSFSMEYRE